MEIQRTQSVGNLSLSNPQGASKNSSQKDHGTETQKNRVEQETVRKPLTENQIKQAVDGFNEMFQLTKTHLKFAYHEKMGEYYVKIIDENTNEVIREIPSKKLLDAISEMKRFIGILFDEKV